MTNLVLDVSQLLTNTTMCSQEKLSDMPFPPVPANPTLSTYPLHTPPGLYHMQKGELTRGEQKPILAPLTHNFASGVCSLLRPGPWSKYTLYHWVRGPHFTQDLLSIDKHLSSLAPPLALRPEPSASSYCSKFAEQAGECNFAHLLEAGTSLSHHAPTSHPQTAWTTAPWRDSSKKRDPRPPRLSSSPLCSFSLDGRPQTTGSLIKGLGGAGWETGAVSCRVSTSFYVIGWKESSEYGWWLLLCHWVVGAVF